jgi:hypothetical protein
VHGHGFSDLTSKLTGAPPAGGSEHHSSGRPPVVRPVERKVRPGVTHTSEPKRLRR